MRLTRRKRKILDILSHSKPRGVSLLSEMRVKYMEGDSSYKERSRRNDQRKSFNRMRRLRPIDFVVATLMSIACGRSCELIGESRTSSL